MAGRDPRADILDNNPFSKIKPKIHRIHSSTSDDGTIHINIGGNSFSKKPKTNNDTRIWHFSDIEKSNLKLATGAFTLALGFMVVRGFGGISSLGFNTWIITLLLSMPLMLLAVGPAFLLHEIGHKIIAKKNGCWAEFRADPKGLQFGVVLAFLLGFLFMAPGAVMVAGNISKAQNGKIALAGPISNIVLFSIGLVGGGLLLGLTSNIFVENFVIAWLWGNSVLAAFNMIPYGPLDGRKVKSWSEPIFWIFMISTLGLAFATITGRIDPILAMFSALV